MGTIPPQVGSRQSCSHTQHLSQFPIPAIGISPLWSRPEQEVVSHLPKLSSSLCHFSNGHDTLILLLQSCSCGIVKIEGGVAPQNSRRERDFSNTFGHPSFS